MDLKQLVRSWWAKLLALYIVLFCVGLISSQLMLVLMTATFVLLVSQWDIVFSLVTKLINVKTKSFEQPVISGTLEQFLQGADALPDGVTVFNAKREVLWCNKTARHLLGLKWPAVKGLVLEDIICDDSFGKKLSNRKHDELIIIPSPHNARVLVENRIIEYIRGHYLMVSRDISHIHQLEQVRQAFVANVSHELKTPLTVLKGYLELLSDSQEPSPAIKAMAAQTTRMQSLIEQLLSLSKIESAMVASLSTPINMPAMLDVIHKDAISLIGDRQLSIEFDIDRALDMVGNESQMFSVCSNLVSNAIRYSPDGSEINLSWQPCETGAQLKVTDTGNGIAAKHLNRLTERFYRIESSRASKDGGSGLGLSIVKHALSNHQSSLMIASEINQGSCFSFFIKHKRLVKPVID